jgi:hypothetical protein
VILTISPIENKAKLPQNELLKYTFYTFAIKKLKNYEGMICPVTGFQWPKIRQTERFYPNRLFYRLFQKSIKKMKNTIKSHLFFITFIKFIKIPLRGPPSVI